MNRNLNPSCRQLLAGLLCTLSIPVVSAQTPQPAPTATATVQTGLQAGVQITPVGSLQLGVRLGLGATAAAGTGATVPQATTPPGELVSLIQKSTGRPLNPAAQRYLNNRQPDPQVDEGGLCRDHDRTFDLVHRSYGSHSPRARRQLNDCSPTLVPFNAAP